MYRINVLIVTYKQADLIGRNIESILQQKEYGLNKIVICDDHSPDNNWEVIQSYKERYPGYITAYRNNTNLGIYGNSNKLVTLRGEADFYCWLEGDDALCDGFFKAAQEHLKTIDVDNKKPFAIMSNFVIRRQDKEDVVDTRNSIVVNNKKWFGLYIRGLVSWRSSLFSAGVMDRFQPAILDQGLSLAESSFDNQFFRSLEEVFYIPVTGSVYYAGIGVSVNLTDEKTAYKTTEGIIQWEYYIKHLVKRRDDICWCKANMQRSSFLLNPGLSKFLRMFFNFVAGYFFTYGFSIRVVLSFWRPVIRRMKVYGKKA